MYKCHISWKYHNGKKNLVNIPSPKNVYIKWNEKLSFTDNYFGLEDTFYHRYRVTQSIVQKCGSKLSTKYSK